MAEARTEKPLSPLLELPNELLIDRTGYLDVSEISTFRLLNRKCNDIGLDELETQIKSASILRSNYVVTGNNQRSFEILSAMSHSPLQKHITEVTLSVRQPVIDTDHKIHMQDVWTRVQQVTPFLCSLTQLEDIWFFSTALMFKKRLQALAVIRLDSIAERTFGETLLAVRGNAGRRNLCEWLYIEDTESWTIPPMYKQWMPWAQELERRLQARNQQKET